MVSYVIKMFHLDLTRSFMKWSQTNYVVWAECSTIKYSQVQKRNIRNEDVLINVWANQKRQNQEQGYMEQGESDLLWRTRCVKMVNAREEEEQRAQIPQ